MATDQIARQRPPTVAPGDSAFTPARRRLSYQICRVVAIMEVLHLQADGICLVTIHEAVNALLPKAVCARTIRRDLDALVIMGFADAGAVTRGHRRLRLYRLASPVLLRHRLMVLGRDKERLSTNRSGRPVPPQREAVNRGSDDGSSVERGGRAGNESGKRVDATGRGAGRDGGRQGSEGNRGSRPGPERVPTEPGGDCRCLS
jgi:hypothetical protein